MTACSMFRVPFMGLMAGIITACVVGLAVGLSGSIPASASPAARQSDASLFWSGVGLGAGMIGFVAFIALTLVFYQESVNIQHIRAAMPNRMLTEIVHHVADDHRAAASALHSRNEEHILSLGLFLCVQAVTSRIVPSATLAKWAQVAFRGPVAAAVFTLLGESPAAFSWTYHNQEEAVTELLQEIRATKAWASPKSRKKIQTYLFFCQLDRSDRSDLGDAADVSLSDGEKQVARSILAFVKDSSVFPYSPSHLARRVKAALASPFGSTKSSGLSSSGGGWASSSVTLATNNNSSSSYSSRLDSSSSGYYSSRLSSSDDSDDTAMTTRRYDDDGEDDDDDDDDDDDSDYSSDQQESSY